MIEFPPATSANLHMSNIKYLYSRVLTIGVSLTFARTLSLALARTSSLALALGVCTSGVAQNPSITPLYDASTEQEPATSERTADALITRIGDRVRDRHARESAFQAYDHYLSFYWEQRSVSFEFIDEVGHGGDNLTINIQSLTELNEPNFRSFFRGLSTVAEYHQNVIAKQHSPTQYSLSIRQHPVENRPLRVGDEIEFEFSPFLAAPQHGRSNYYGTTMLYVVGKGIVPWMGVGPRLESVPLPETTLLGGGTTLSYPYSDEPSERFKQMAGNISPLSVQKFLLGRRLHHTNMRDGTHSEQPNPTFQEQSGKLGPNFVAESCIACHVNNGRALPSSVHDPMYQAVVKVAGDSTGTPHPKLGRALQPQSLSGDSEGSATIVRYQMVEGAYGDGTRYVLRKPIYEFDDEPAFYSVRLTPPLVGLGLLEAISEQDILALADPDDADHDGISGRPQLVRDPQTHKTHLGRFGYKAGQPSLRHQIAAALNSDMGVTTSIAPTLDDDRRLDGDSPARRIEMMDDDLSNLVRYVSLLGVNAQRALSESEQARGRTLFREANCAACHTPSISTGSSHPFAELREQAIQPFTDLLLHDMGEGLADSLGEHVATGSEWRTAPLWGIGWTRGVSDGEAYLHDGRARTLEEAILWHGGEAEASKEAFRQMPEADRKSLVRYLQSL